MLSLTTYFQKNIVLDAVKLYECVQITIIKTDWIEYGNHKYKHWTNWDNININWPLWDWNPGQMIIWTIWLTFLSSTKIYPWKNSLAKSENYKKCTLNFDSLVTTFSQETQTITSWFWVREAGFDRQRQTTKNRSNNE